MPDLKMFFFRKYSIEYSNNRHPTQILWTGLTEIFLLLKIFSMVFMSKLYNCVLG